mmetsp:Transcript_20188/g.29962  ORF Transcript_20188/g.29962 Transcript_20188/m.29962 type:complete len:155 (-) Transcript_20188:87-551(-)
MRVLYPPDKFNDDPSMIKSVFLAGTIDMGNSEDWQKTVVDECCEKDVVFYNPRRKDWNSEWEQKIGDNKFTEQVEWELESLENVDLILMYLAPGSKSPISMLELGIFAKTDKLVVCCPDGFWRKGNIDIVCRKYGIKQVEGLKDFQQEIKRIIA